MSMLRAIRRNKIRNGYARRPVILPDDISDKLSEKQRLLKKVKNLMAKLSRRRNRALA